MPLIDLKCESPDCGHHYEYMRPLADYPKTPACEKCGGSTVQYHPPPQSRWTIDPVVVFRAPDGSFRFPGDPAGAGASRYAREGFERIELRSAADVRRFETQMNRREYARAERRIAIAQQNRELRERHQRGELRRLMPSMSPRMRDLARTVIERNNQKPGLSAKEAGFHVEAFSYDRSNRDESRDAQGRRRRD